LSAAAATLDAPKVWAVSNMGMIGSSIPTITVRTTHRLAVRSATVAAVPKNGASGATTDDGFPGHMFNWDVVLGIRAALTQLGVRTAMSRGNDNAFTTSRLAGERIASVFHRLGPHGGAGLWNLKTHIEIRVNLDTGIEPVRR
jgi:hypothetical protein